MALLRRGFKTWCENAARGYRRELGLSAIAPLDPRALAEHLGIIIWTPADVPSLSARDVHHLTSMVPESWSAATLQDGDASLIIINNAHSRTRQNNSLAHEIGHVVLRHEPAKMYFTPDNEMIMSEYNPVHEEEATCFAGTLLLPREALLEVILSGLSDRAAAECYGVSVAVLRMRRNTTGVDIQLSRRRGISAP